VGGTCGTHGRGEESVQGLGDKARRREHLEDQGVDGRMGSEWILGCFGGECSVDPDGSAYGLVAGSCEYGDEPSGSGATELVS
jgi:hypothetical protein